MLLTAIHCQCQLLPSTAPHANSHAVGRAHHHPLQWHCWHCCLSAPFLPDSALLAAPTSLQQAGTACCCCKRLLTHPVPGNGTPWGTWASPQLTQKRVNMQELPKALLSPQHPLLCCLPATFAPDHGADAWDRGHFCALGDSEEHGMGRAPWQCQALCAPGSLPD